MGNVFGETPNTAGEDARAPQYSGDLAATVFMEVLQWPMAGVTNSPLDMGRGFG